ncbi:GntR family transcriptional regulator [Aliicoccus persicus]|uniref:GntR family transcriptional regulator n=1 Tax=Aliicoccus persicus TaxID=930138 RepID=A0A662Z3D0_9STAP|nr:GntR family transcriptional regulator [Aliicoccus persicus]SEW01846.1 GntR family transcriptional regulator [Aliicoccus persicus]
MIQIDMKSRTPIYEQLINRIKLLMAQEVLQPGDQLPSVRVLAGELTVNPNTIQKAYRALESEGYVYSLPGKGSFVNDMKETINNDKIAQLKTELIRIFTELSLLNVSKAELIEWMDAVENLNAKESGDTNENHN